MTIGGLEILNTDCVEYMKTLKDNAFDLAIVDPPYGDALSGNGFNWGGQIRRSVRQVQESILRHGGGWFAKYGEQDGELPP